MRRETVASHYRRLAVLVPFLTQMVVVQCIWYYSTVVLAISPLLVSNQKYRCRHNNSYIAKSIVVRVLGTSTPVLRIQRRLRYNGVHRTTLEWNSVWSP